LAQDKDRAAKWKKKDPKSAATVDQSYFRVRQRYPHGGNAVATRYRKRKPAAKHRQTEGSKRSTRRNREQNKPNEETRNTDGSNNIGHSDLSAGDDEEPKRRWWSRRFSTPHRDPVCPLAAG